MKTEVVMKRKLFGEEISQKSKTQYFSATDLVRAGNKWRISQGLQPFNLSEYFRNRGTQEFIEEIEKKYKEVKITAVGRGSHTWVHPLLFIDIALAISPKLKVETYEWLYDNLLRFRNDSGDSYKKLTGALFERSTDKHAFHRYISQVALQIQEACGVEDWQTATEEQLKKRDRIHENITLLCSVLKNRDEAVRLGILNSK